VSQIASRSNSCGVDIPGEILYPKRATAGCHAFGLMLLPEAALRKSPKAWSSQRPASLYWGTTCFRCFRLQHSRIVPWQRKHGTPREPHVTASRMFDLYGRA